MTLPMRASAGSSSVEATIPTGKTRQHARLPLRMSAEVHTEAGMFIAVTRDLSEGGVAVELSAQLPEGELVTLGLFLVVDDVEEERVPPLWVKGRVVWSAEQDTGGSVAGVRFEVITEAQRKWLRHLLAHLGAPSRAR